MLPLLPMPEREQPPPDSAEAFELLDGKTKAAELVVGLLRKRGAQSGVILPFPDEMAPVAALATFRQGELSVLAFQCGVEVDADLFPREPDVVRVSMLAEALFSGLSSSSPSPTRQELHAEHVQFLQRTAADQLRTAAA